MSSARSHDRAAEFLVMPDVVPGAHELRLIAWRIAEGEPYAEGAVLAEIESDKAVVEFVAPTSGVIETFLVDAGTDVVAVGERIARIGPGQPRTDDGHAQSTDRRIVATPVARSLALAAGLDLREVSGSGPNGRITKRDVAAVASRRPAAPTCRSGEARVNEAAAAEGCTLRSLNGMRAAMARQMTRSVREAPHFSLTVDLRVDALIEARRHFNAGPGYERASINDFVVRAAAIALQRVPEANATFVGDAVALHAESNIAVAVAIEGGLVTPVVRQCDRKSLAAVSRELSALIDRARARALRPDELTGGTFTVSNLGMFGVRSFTSILNASQACILSVGAADSRPVVVDGRLAIGSVMSVTLTCDHRSVDGAIGARWLASFRDLIENPDPIAA